MGNKSLSDPWIGVTRLTVLNKISSEKIHLGRTSINQKRGYLKTEPYLVGTSVNVVKKNRSVKRKGWKLQDDREVLATFHRNLTPPREMRYASWQADVHQQCLAKRQHEQSGLERTEQPAPTEWKRIQKKRIQHAWLRM